ncbi:hypothetical protein [Inquilinus sp. Marseille-Q2685]|uniref:hypothetical protein n=1 Tax=Inquilinus sp. Marseille-Q2685 TaxID=2866581 RepID=UPI001CE4B562|nr:hypothetical protein [Inquilinus sp. Marseille-Q2685]
MDIVWYSNAFSSQMLKKSSVLSRKSSRIDGDVFGRGGNGGTNSGMARDSGGSRLDGAKVSSRRAFREPISQVRLRDTGDGGRFRAAEGGCRPGGQGKGR